MILTQSKQKSKRNIDLIPHGLKPLRVYRLRELFIGPNFKQFCYWPKGPEVVNY